MLNSDARSVSSDSAPIFLRVAGDADIASLEKLVNSAYRGDSSRKGWTTEADLLGGQRTDADALRELLADPAAQTILIHSSESGIEACVYLKRQGRTTYLGMLTVDPGGQARGLGKRLLAAAELWSRKNWAAEKIEMTVLSPRLELLAWYERRGYEKTARREPFPYGNPRFGLPKTGDLEFIVLEKHLTERS